MIVSSLSANPFLKAPELVSPKQLKELEDTWPTEFSWSTKALRFTCCYHNKQAGFLLQAYGLPIRSYNFNYFHTIKRGFKLWYEGYRYYYDKPLYIPESTPQGCTFDQWINFLSTKKCIFYTGAGISASAQVPTMKELIENLDLIQLKQKSSSFIHNTFFKPLAFIKAFDAFCIKMITTAPTPAHHALHTIAQHIHTAILTENLDLLHQRAGSMPITPLIMKSPAFFTTLKDEDFQTIDAIVCIGLSYDDCGFLANYKNKNSQGIIIALNFEQPTYLSNQDFWLQGDIQSILPMTVEKIRES